MDLPKVLSEVYKEIQAVITNTKTDLHQWTEERVTGKDPVKMLTGGSLDTVS